LGHLLPKQGDSVTYLVTIKNSGNVDAYTSGLTVGKFIDGVQKASVYPLDAQYEGITSDELIPAGTTKTFTVTLSYEKSDVVLTNSKLTYTIFLKFIQK
jgi:archaellum component FlaG (FlaF/FlaG flagellin family)